MLRISATTLEKFRRYMNDASSFDTEEALIQSLEGLFLGNLKTRTGEAYHKLIEFPDPAMHLNAETGMYQVGEISFTPDQAMPAFAYAKAHPIMVHEVPVYKVYDIGRMKIMVTMRIDCIEGRELRDIKTKYRNPDFEEYMDSAQWKFYLDALGLDVFWYDVFEVKGFNEMTGVVEKTQFIPHEPLRCARYLGLEKDCLELVKAFMEYIELRNFYHLLKEAKEYESLAI